MTTDTYVKSFADFGVDQRICDALTAHGITTPFPIQELTLPLALSGADLIGQARTGTGKTLGFGIPLLHRADEHDRTTQALIIVPTRELCLQVRDDLARAGERKGINVVALYGGRSIDEQVRSLGDGAPIVVGTPGRLLDLLRRGNLDLSAVSGLVLDEADEMLDLGFLPDVEQLIQACRPQRQTLLFSATMPSAVVALARRYMSKPTFLRADVDEVHVAPETQQHFLSCHRMDKPAVLARILQSPGRGLCVVFTRTKRMADVLAEELRGMGVNASPIHSDLRQEARERALAKFRKGTIDVLVATEVAARGLDITDVTHVVNYDCPDDEKMYLHRIGRTGRAGAAGVAITLAVWNELARLEMIKRELGITEPTHEVFSTSPVLDELFDLPPRGAAPAPFVQADDADPEPRTAAASERTSSSRRRRGGRGRRPAQTAAEGRPRDEEPRPTQRSAIPATGDADDTPVVARSRTRRRSRPDQADAAAATRPAVSDDSPPDAQPAATPPTGEGERAVRTRTRTRQRSTATTPRPPATPKPKSAAGTGREPAQPRQERDRGGSRGGGRSARGGKPAPRARDQRPVKRPARRVDVGTARGDGKPALFRPLDITHLP